MEKLYLMLIEAGRKTLEDVPHNLREKVAALINNTN